MMDQATSDCMKELQRCRAEVEDGKRTFEAMRSQLSDQVDELQCDLAAAVEVLRDMVDAFDPFIIYRMADVPAYKVHNNARAILARLEVRT